MVGRQAQIIPTLTSTLDQIIEELESSAHMSAIGIEKGDLDCPRLDGCV